MLCRRPKHNSYFSVKCAKPRSFELENIKIFLSKPLHHQIITLLTLFKVILSNRIELWNHRLWYAHLFLLIKRILPTSGQKITRKVFSFVWKNTMLCTFTLLQNLIFLHLWKIVCCVTRTEKHFRRVWIFGAKFAASVKVVFYRRNDVKYFSISISLSTSLQLFYYFLRHNFSYFGACTINI